MDVTTLSADFLCASLEGLALGANATQLQVSAGALAGWTQVDTRTGIHFVEDLA